MPRPDTDEDPPRVAESKMSLEIGNEEAVSGVYKQFFESIPQAACKEIAKALVELMTPEKCTNGAALGWWPKELNDLDYLSNKERAVLLAYILTIASERPENQHPDIRELNISIKKLRTAAVDSISFFKYSAKQRSIIEEPFKIAGYQEKYKRDEYDSTTHVFATVQAVVMDCFSDERGGVVDV